MRFFEWIRSVAFWSLDVVKKSEVKNHLKDITSINTSPFSKTAIHKRETYLYELLNHAVNTTDFYKKHNSSLSLDNFPIIDKNIIRDNFEGFISNIYNKEKLIEVSTSGSTGTAFKVLQNKNKKTRNTADTLYFSNLVGYKIGYKLFYLRHWNKTYSKNKFLGWLQHIVRIEVLDINNAYIDALTKNLIRDTSNKSWIGFSSAYEQICKLLDEKNEKPIKANVKSIIAISESLNDYTKDRISYYFNAPIVSRYSNMENGIIAQQKVNENTFEINWASYYIEILELDSNKPVNSGEIGRIVITDLFNYAMPLIRYDTGDLGSINLNTDTPYFKTIEGRKTDAIYNTKGDLISAFVWSSLNKFKGIKQYQMIQEDRAHYTLNLNVDESFNKNAQVIEDCKKYLGEDANVTVNYIQTIPLLASGKRKTTINNFIK